jgi:hypothetical protein
VNIRGPGANDKASTASSIPQLLTRTYNITNTTSKRGAEENGKRGKEGRVLIENKL